MVALTKTIIQKINKDKFQVEELRIAAGILQEGGLVAFPTETVYGLGGNGLDTSAARKIYEAKGRPSDNPLIIHIADVERLENLVSDIPTKAKELADAYWPGPLTMIFRKNVIVPLSTTGGLDTVAIRIPEHPIALELIRQADVCIAAPSANSSGKPSPTIAKHVIDDLNGKVDMIIDGGKVGIGLESTIIDMTVEPPIILRPGYITKAQIEHVIGNVSVDAAILNRNPEINLVPKAPGMKYRHYAPVGELTIFEGNSQAVVKAINRITEEKAQEGKKVGIIATEESETFYTNGIVKVIGTRKSEESIAKELYAVLREFDDEQVQYIYSESFTSDDLGQAIMNRLIKAAGYKMVQVDKDSKEG